MIIKQKITEWVKRYLPAEIISTAATLLIALLVNRQGGSAVAVALASTWSGNICYFGYIFIADVYYTQRDYQKNNKKYTAASAVYNLRNLIVEFGLAEALDSLLIRPLVMYYLPAHFTDFSTGILIAKLTADVFFYVPAIIGYELNKKYIK